TAEGNAGTPGRSVSTPPAVSRPRHHELDRRRPVGEPHGGRYCAGDGRVRGVGGGVVARGAGPRTLTCAISWKSGRLTFRVVPSEPIDRDTDARMAACRRATRPWRRALAPHISWPARLLRRHSSRSVARASNLPRRAWPR